MKIDFPYADEVILVNLLFAGLLALIANYILIYFNIVEEINLVFVAVFAVLFFLIKVGKFVLEVLK